MTTTVECEVDRVQPQLDVTAGGYEFSRLNALRHGVLAKHTVLPWEDEREYQDLVDTLIAEHAATGPTEVYLVIELAGILWRKRRLRLAEKSTFQRSLWETTSTSSKTRQSALLLAAERPKDLDVAEAIRAGSADTAEDIAWLEDDRKRTIAALEILKTERNCAYEDAIEILEKSTREAWQDQLSWQLGDYDTGATPFTPDASSLRRYLEEQILGWYDRTRAEIEARPLVRQQALGELLDPDKLERLGKYEVHLDRKFERTLSTLMRLQELRRGRDEGDPAS